jgi:hypothetical protein
MLRDDPLAPGQVQLYDNLVPTLAPGDWHITVEHDVRDGDTPVTPQPFRATQEVTVTAPQFTIDAAAVLATFPPDTSSGRYAEVLPHVVLTDPSLPWERRTGGEGTPWLALLVLTDDELIGADGSPTRTHTATVGEFLAPDPLVRKPVVTRDAAVADTDPCGYVQLPTGVFTAVTPRLAELPYLAHCRQINTADKVIDGLDEHGMFAVVVANRFPAAAKNVAHLVSLEGLADVLVDEPDWDGHTSVAVATLASWTFAALPDQDADFRGLVAGLIPADPQQSLLRLAVPYPQGTEPSQVEARERLRAGFVPLTYRTRSGEDTFGWHRGPLTPVLPAPLPSTAGAWRTADAALAYDPAHGVFDVSLAGAFTLGRCLALADRAFAQRLLDLRQRLHAFTDALLYRLTCDHFSATQIDQIGRDTTIQTELLAVLDAQLLADLGAGPAPVAPPVPVAPPIPVTDPDPQTALREFLATPAAQAAIVDAVAIDLDPVAQWLARLMLLYPVPFTALVADERLLPPESLRFCYLDPNWVTAAVDGALSIGLESSLHTFYADIIRDTVAQAATDAARMYRDVLLGLPPATPPPAGTGPTAGLLLRSALVAGWPNLSVRGVDAAGAPVPLLRMDRLGPSVLLCLFAGVPHQIELSEPQEGFAFGVDGGEANLRNLLPPPNPHGWQIGEAITGAVVPILDPTGARPVCLRSVASRVLILDPAVPRGVVATLGAALDAALGQRVSPLRPADLAIELVRPPEVVRFTAPPDDANVTAPRGAAGSRRSEGS